MMEFLPKSHQLSNDGEEINQLNILLVNIYNLYGYDFRNYAKASLKRRIAGFMEKKNLQGYLELKEKLMASRALFDEFLIELSVTVTEMFRDPDFYKAFRKKVVPILKTYPFIKIWHAGCATGEEVYSMAILLYEEGFLSKSTLYATDFNVSALEKAKNGIYKAQHVKQYIQNYNKSGGKAIFSDYYYANYGVVKIHDFLKQRIIFSHHNLAADQVFGEMNVIICRNVLIYFDRTLQNKVLKLFCSSLCHRGFLCLGSKETLDYTNVDENFEKISIKERIYRMRT